MVLRTNVKLILENCAIELVKDNSQPFYHVSWVLKGYVMFREHSNGGMIGIKFHDVDFLESELSWKGDI